MPNQKKYWKSEVELNDQSTLADDLAQKEFVQKLPEDLSATLNCQKVILLAATS